METFTIECEKRQSFKFLDVKLDTSSGKLKTSIYRKSTITGLLLNYFSFTPKWYKIGLIRCLVDRIYRVNNTKPDFDDELSKLFSILGRNSYPQQLSNKIASNYLDQKLNHGLQVLLRTM